MYAAQLRTSFRARWDRLRESYWFVPVLIVIGAILLAIATIRLDRRLIGGTFPGASLLYAGDADGAREVLGVLAASMITVASLTFSITVVALTLASQQFGPRLLRNFVRDTVTQVMLGLFLATFLYCLLVLRTVTGNPDESFVPHLSVSTGMGLSVISLGMLIYFIHHVSTTIQASNLVASVAAELDGAIEELFEEDLAGGGGEGESPVAAEIYCVPEGEPAIVTATRDGYLQVVDGALLYKVAAAHDLCIELRHRAGHFVSAGAELVRAWPAHALNHSVVEEIRSAFVQGNQRTLVQDAEFAIDQIVEIAVRALSPGVNDPFTAMTCIDRLSASLQRALRHHRPSGWRVDRQGRVRLVARPDTFDGLVRAAFDQIRQASRGNTAVSIRLLEGLGRIALAARRDDDRETLRRQALMIARGAREAIPEPEDRQDVERRYRELLQALDEGGAREGTALAARIGTVSREPGDA